MKDLEIVNNNFVSPYEAKEKIDISPFCAYSMDLQSTVSVAKVGTNSVRTTIPQGIVSYLDIQVGDKIKWRMVEESGKRAIIIFKSDGKKLNQLDDAFKFKHFSI